MKIITTVITVIILSICLLAIKPVREKAQDTIWNWVTYELDKEEEKREEQIRKHEVVRGKDTVFVFNKHYYILRHMGEMRFGVQNEELHSNIFQKVNAFDSYRNRFYVVAKDGYAVVDRDNLCRISLLSDIEKVESKYIEYLTSYEEFSEEEQKHFSKMIKKQKVDLYK